MKVCGASGVRQAANSPASKNLPSEISTENRVMKKLCYVARAGGSCTRSPALYSTFQHVVSRSSLDETRRIPALRFSTYLLRFLASLTLYTVKSYVYIYTLRNTCL